MDQKDQPNKIGHCQNFSDLNNVMPGWGCCMCRTYNGHHRNECKHCGHKRCDLVSANQAS